MTEIWKPERGREMEFTDEEQNLIEAIKSRGLDDPETNAKFQEWSLKGEEEAKPDGDIALHIHRALFYRAAGFSEEAWDTLNAVRVRAAHEKPELLTKVEAVMDAIEAGDSREKSIE